MDQKIEKKIAEWTKEPFDSETIAELKDLVAKEDFEELKDRFYTSLRFGTGGLRGILGAGTNRMNVYTVGMATQGLANYIKKNKGQEQGLVVAYDSRKKSDLFAREVAEIMAANGIKTYFFLDITPTPLASYAIRKLSAISGVVVTASHNPPEYNGYKAYWENGGQVIPPHDEGIIKEVEKITSIKEIKKITYEEGLAQGLIKKIGNEMLTSYLEDLERASFKKREPSDLRIVYTPLHGTGYKIIPQVLDHFGFQKVFLEKDQMLPDGNFPTVKTPNPEEQEAMSLAIKLAKEKKAEVILATDPDADRLGVAFKKEQGDFFLMNGNQIGTMLLYYLLLRFNESSKVKGQGFAVKTIVTTDLQREICEDFGVQISEVLTGFKWIAAKMEDDFQTENKKFIFAGEESHGYLPVDFVRDKDAVSTVYFFAEMADWLKKRGITLEKFLNEIYLKYSFYLEDLASLTLKGVAGSKQIAKIMANFRSNPPFEISGYQVEKILDFKSLVAKDCLKGIAIQIAGFPASDVLQFFLQDNIKVTMRPSGTEPKIKFYFSLKKKIQERSLNQEKKEIEQKLELLKNNFIKTCLEV